MAKILNIGSLNLDYVYAVPHFVAAGETLLASRRDVFAGGKGLNQTVAAARAGAEVCHGGAVGADGDMLLDLLRDAGADVSAVARVDVPTGHAVIQVTPQGENAILILGGANRAVSRYTADETRCVSSATSKSRGFPSMSRSTGSRSISFPPFMIEETSPRPPRAIERFQQRKTPLDSNSGNVHGGGTVSSSPSVVPLHGIFSGARR